jgi:hypothetical protein
VVANWKQSREAGLQAQEQGIFSKLQARTASGNEIEIARPKFDNARSEL